MSGSEVEVRAVIADFVEFWNHHDIESFSNLFTDDADFINADGQWWKGRRAIRDNEAVLHSMYLKTAHLAARSSTVRFLRADLAIAHVQWEMTGRTDLTRKALEMRSGLLTLIISKVGPRWRIAANTEVLNPVNTSKN